MLKLSEEIQSELSRAIAELKLSHETEPSDTRSKLAVEFGGLPIYADMGGAVILFSSGELLTAPHDTGKLVPTDTPFDTVALAVGTERYPWLQPLLPVRMVATEDCSTCKGAGRVALGSTPNGASPICGTCFGLGWVHDS
jgi:hypothetical protein